MNAESSATRWVRLSFASACIALTLGLGSCGGGDATSALSSDAKTAATRQAISAVATTETATVIAVTKVSETRVSRTVFDYVFKVTVQNGPVLQTGVTATLTNAGVGTTIIDGTVVVGDMKAGAIVIASDTITLRQDRALPFNPTSLKWRIESTPDLDSASVLVGPEGGTVNVPSGKIKLIVPAGALSVAQLITVTTASPDIQDSSLGNFAFNLGPEGLVFSVPVTIVARYDPIDLPIGNAETDQHIVFRAADGWSSVPTVVDKINMTLTATTTHFSDWGVSSTVTPRYQGISGSVPYAKWEIKNGCLRRTDSEMVKIHALSKAIFHWSTPPDPDKPTEAGCVTEPYLATGYSYDTYKWDLSNPPIGLENHAGIDFRAPINTPAYAVAEGEVKEAILDTSVPRSTLIIESKIGGITYWIFYLHCNSHLFSKGQRVAKGDQVCSTGKVGANDPHLHFEVKVKGVDVDSNKNDYLSAMGGSHCPNSRFMAYNGSKKGFTLERAGCTEANLTTRTVDPVVVAQSGLDDQFNGTMLDPAIWNPRNWTGGPTLPYGVPTVGNGLVHLSNCQGIDTANKVMLSGSRFVIESRFAGQKPTGRDSSIALVDPTTGLEFMFHETNYRGWGQTIQLATNGIGSFNGVYGGTTSAFKAYRITMQGANVTVERGDTLTTLTERFSVVLPRTVTDGTYYLRLGTGGCDGVYSPADFDWIRVTTY